MYFITSEDIMLIDISVNVSKRIPLQYLTECMFVSCMQYVNSYILQKANTATIRGKPFI